MESVSACGVGSVDGDGSVETTPNGGRVDRRPPAV